MYVPELINIIEKIRYADLVAEADPDENHPRYCAIKEEIEELLAEGTDKLNLANDLLIEMVEKNGR